MNTAELIKEKMHSNHRVLDMEPITPDAVRDARGIIDKGLFTGDQKVNAFRGPFDNLWRLKYSHGNLPPALRNTWTSFPQLYSFCTTYFFKRGLKITGVTDIHDDDSDGFFN